MSKKIGEMNVLELGQLYPIILSEYNADWKDCYVAEQIIIEEALGVTSIARMNHYGSTAIPGLLAKPTIDILLEIKEDTDPEQIKNSLLNIGYSFSPQPSNPPPHMMFMKGYTERGFEGQAVHLHVRYLGDWDELYFRDYLILKPEKAMEYALLKKNLKELFENDREAYTRGKSEFIKKVTQEAREELDCRYA